MSSDVGVICRWRRRWSAVWFVEGQHHRWPDTTIISCQWQLCRLQCAPYVQPPLSPPLSISPSMIPSLPLQSRSLILSVLVNQSAPVACFRRLINPLSMATRPACHLILATRRWCLEPQSMSLSTSTVGCGPLHDISYQQLSQERHVNLVSSRHLAGIIVH